MYPFPKPTRRSLLRRTRIRKRGFTLVEILVVLGIIAFLASALTVTIATYLTSAREAQTVATLRKIDGLLTERQQALTRFFDSRDFRNYTKDYADYLRKGDIATGRPQLFGFDSDFTEALTKKDLLRQSLPQHFGEMADLKDTSGALVPGGDGIPDRIQQDENYKLIRWADDPNTPETTLVPWRDEDGNSSPDLSDSFHKRETESSELLYFALTRLEQFGAPAIGEGEFRSNEVADTDGDGMLEFVDGWGNPLRFYRWPTRLIKPFGLLGYDNAFGLAGVDDDNNTFVDDINDIAHPRSDDAAIPQDVRNFAALYFDGLPRQPIMVRLVPSDPNSALVPVAGDFDQLNEDGDDPFGLLLYNGVERAAQFNDFQVLTGLSESRFHTLNTYHKPLVVSAGADGILGLYEPFHNEDTNLNGILDGTEDAAPNGNGNGYLDIGWLAQPFDEDADFTTYTAPNPRTVWDGSPSGDFNGNGSIDSILTPVAALDDITNRNRRAGE